MPKIDRRSFLATGAIVGMAAPRAIAAAPSSPLTVTGLRTAMREAPLGIDDPQPALSWRIEAGAGIVQAAYRILVSSSAAALKQGRGDLWDSGRVESAACTGILYNGHPLRSGQTCHWNVQVWEQTGKSSQSQPSLWEMGLLAAADSSIWPSKSTRS